MASIVNERDLLLQNSTQRAVDVTLPSNVVPPALKAVTLAAPSTTFRVATDNSSSPSAITLNANLRAISGTPTMTWSVTPTGAATLTGTDYGVRTLTYANMAQDYCTVRVEVNDGGMIYFDEMSFAKVRDGSKGVDGRRGSISTAKAVTGSTWSDAQALQALVDLGATTPLATDTVTLYNASANYAEMRRYDGTGWVAVASSMPGSVLMNGSIVTEKLLVTGLGIALNPDPNTQDISAWTGTGLSIVTDTTSPSGSTALECTGLAATVLSKKFPIDPTKNYKARLWTKQQSGTSTTYGTVAFYDASGNVITGTSNGTGWPGKGTFHYFGLVNGALPAAWTEYSISFGPGESVVLPSNARFMAIGVLSNYTGTGVQRVAAPLVHLKTTGDMVVDGTLTASKIDTRGLVIRDTEANGGGVLFGAGTALDWGLIGGTNKPADGATVGMLDSEASTAYTTTNGWSINKDGSFTAMGGGNKILVGSGSALIQFNKPSGGTAFAVDSSGSAVFGGALLGASGTFSGTLAAGVLDNAAFDSIVYEYTTAGSFTLTIPAKKADWTGLNMRVTLIGGGGGGGGAGSSTAPNRDPTSSGGGGGAGTKLIYNLTSGVTSGGTLSITVGAGGAGGASNTVWNGTSVNGSPGGNGGNSSVQYSSATYIASGGGGGGAGTTALADAYGNYATGDGGGAGGSLGGMPGAGGFAVTVAGGAGGSSEYGAGGSGGSAAYRVANPGGNGGVGAGGGGGGAYPGYAGKGGNGGPGRVRIEFYDPNLLVRQSEYQDYKLARENWEAANGVASVENLTTGVGSYSSYAISKQSNGRLRLLRTNFNCADCNCNCNCGNS